MDSKNSKINYSSISIIVPTYQERDNLASLVERIEAVKDKHNYDLELLIMDDDSQDGSEEVIRSLEKDWVKLHIRIANRGLSLAVIDGLDRAKKDVLVVMDADLSHPPETVPDLIRAIRDGAEFVIGSRYVAGGSTSDDWGVLRWLNSRLATLMALPFTTAKDPMSGFFCLTNTTYKSSKSLNPVGYKIGLELIVKCNITRVDEVPIHFEQRKSGESKLTMKEQLRYIQHIRRLFIYKFGTWSHLVQFLTVGGMGSIVNIAILTVLLTASVGIELAVALAIFLSMNFNFALNRRFTFSYARRDSIAKQYVGFMATCSIGAVVNYLVTFELLSFAPSMWPQVAAFFGIMAGSAFNFILNHYGVFGYGRKKQK
jgi:dolichol-phosphate mannosyltransferase